MIRCISALLLLFALGCPGGDEAPDIAEPPCHRGEDGRIVCNVDPRAANCTQVGDQWICEAPK